MDVFKQCEVTVTSVTMIMTALDIHYSQTG